MEGMFITGLYVSVEIAIRLEPPHEAEMILSDYKREVGQFAPASVKCTWSQLGGGDILWPTAEVAGRRTIKRGAHARVRYAEDDNGSIDHWPAYVLAAMKLAQDQVSR